jgi:pimeloyl-ACP methyl ester carboxylesterase
MTDFTADSIHTLSPRPTRRWLRSIALAFAALSVLTLAWNVGARLSLALMHPPPGERIDMGGYALHLNCMGEALSAPTILLEAGNADFSVHWSKVQSEIAAFARVCAYDRAGLGWSDRGTEPRTVAAMTADLATLLERAGVDGPLIIVGHSFGAILARNYAATRPDRVTGLVLLDPAHERQLESPAMRDAVAAGVAQFEALAPLASYGLLAMLPGTIPERGLPADAHGDYAAILATTGYFTVAAEETAMLAANLEAAPMGGLGDLPMTVISRGRADVPAGTPATEIAELETQWRALQDETARLSTTSRLIIAEGSGHYVQLERPDLVVAAVREMAGKH